MSMQTINTASEYDAMLAATTIPPSETVGGIERHARFETLDSSQIETLNEYCRENVRVARLVVSSPDMALHILGGRKLTPRNLTITLGGPARQSSIITVVLTNTIESSNRPIWGT